MSTENMNIPTEKQIQEVLTGTSTPEIARIVAAWFATDEGAAYLAKSMDRDAVEIKQGFEELYVDHEIPSEEMLAHIRRNIRQKRVRRIAFRVAACRTHSVCAADRTVCSGEYPCRSAGRFWLRRNLCTQR